MSEESKLRSRRNEGEVGLAGKRVGSELSLRKLGSLENAVSFPVESGAKSQLPRVLMVFCVFG